MASMGESAHLGWDVTDCPPGCTCSHLHASEGVDRLLRAEFARPTLQPSRLLRQRLRQRIAHEDSLWRPLERLAGSHAEAPPKFFTLPLPGPQSLGAALTVNEFLPERRSDRSEAR
jgi:hypothetical protein